MRLLLFALLFLPLEMSAQAQSAQQQIVNALEKTEQVVRPNRPGCGSISLRMVSVLKNGKNDTMSVKLTSSKHSYEMRNGNAIVRKQGSSMIAVYPRAKRIIRKSDVPKDAVAPSAPFSAKTVAELLQSFRLVGETQAKDHREFLLQPKNKKVSAPYTRLIVRIGNDGLVQQIEAEYPVGGRYKSSVVEYDVSESNSGSCLPDRLTAGILTANGRPTEKYKNFKVTNN